MKRKKKADSHLLFTAHSVSLRLSNVWIQLSFYSSEILFWSRKIVSSACMRACINRPHHKGRYCLCEHEIIEMQSGKRQKLNFCTVLSLHSFPFHRMCHVIHNSKIEYKKKKRTTPLFFVVVTLTLFILAFIYSDFSVMGKCAKNFGVFFIYWVCVMHFFMDIQRHDRSCFLFINLIFVERMKNEMYIENYDIGIDLDCVPVDIQAITMLRGWRYILDISSTNTHTHTCRTNSNDNNT